jgi:chromosome segregation ATPase
MIAETKRRVSQLQEIIRALTQDLDISRRNAAEFASERDVLQEHVERLQNEIKTQTSLGEIEDLRLEKEKLRRQLVNKQREIDEMRRELDVLLCDSEASRARTNHAEKQLSILHFRFRDVEEERDEIKLQFDESAVALEEIRNRLLNLPNPNEEVIGGEYLMHPLTLKYNRIPS